MEKVREGEKRKNRRDSRRKSETESKSENESESESERESNFSRRKIRCVPMTNKGIPRIVVNLWKKGKVLKWEWGQIETDEYEVR